ncbi:acyl- dehydrogenase [Lasius niger]|uniref:Acyl-dehydrogenase n=1 Tax=Lasius niger TaxID=67767 RepID=A0A0J7KA20_LASNI|nr:acyl- dehydrogenase [Lasius niger]
MSGSEESPACSSQRDKEISDSESYDRRSSVKSSDEQVRRQGRKKGYFNLVDYEDDSNKENSGPSLKRSHSYSANPSLESLQNQDNFLTSLLWQKPAATSVSTPMGINQTFLERPGTSLDTRRLDLGSFKTDVDERRRLCPANKDRLEILKGLQRFGSVDWKEVRYSKALRSFLVSPGFTDLRVNEELCHLDRKKNLLLPIDRVLGGLCNAVLEQKELLQNGLQGIVNWAFANPTSLSPEALFDRLS